MAAHARSKKAEAKKARRNKRRAGRDATWLPDNVMGELVATQAAIAADLEAFDARITERGWDFDDELSDDELAIWYFAPSEAEVDDESVQAGDRGLPDRSGRRRDRPSHVRRYRGWTHSLTPDEFFEHIDAIEAYRVGDPRPDLHHS